MELLERIKLNAKKYNKRIVLPESLEERTLRAADEIIAEGLAQVILTANSEEVYREAKNLGLKHIDQAVILDPAKHAKREQYADLMVELRKSKGMTKDEAIGYSKIPFI